jgi:uncharacterized phage protein gp47/JayE
MATYPLPTLAAQVSPTGISAPAYSEVVNSDVATYTGIYGDDVLLTPDTQDYQLIATRALAIRDSNDLAITLYNSYSPSGAQGVGLSSQVQINGLNREAATNSTVILEIVGVAGTPIPAGVVKDENGNLWNLPTNLTIPPAGTLTETATAQQAGAISAIAGSVNTPYTVISGWQSVTNPAAATPGTAVETDAALRQRQKQSTSLASQTPLSSILAAVANSGGIARFEIYENNTRVADGNGQPGNSVAVVVEGGDATTVATVIEAKKAPGTGTYGTTSVTVIDPAGVPITINFFEMTEVPIYAAITIQPLTGYVASTGTALVAALANFIASLNIGQDVIFNWLLGVAGLSGSPLALTFAITSLTIGLAPGSLAGSNIPIAFNAGATCVPANIILTVI